MSNGGELLKASEVAQRARVHTQTVRRWVRDGRLAVVRLPGGELRFTEADVLELLSTQTPESAA